MEPRARAARHKGQLNFGSDLKHMLHAFGAPGSPIDPNAPPHSAEPYPETLRVLDEILTDYIIETCHAAVEVANYSNRQKLKPSDFEFVLRKDAAKLGHVQAMFEKKRNIDRERKGADFEGLGGGGMGGGRMGVDDLTALANEVGEEGTRKGVGRGRGRRKKEREEPAGDGEAERPSKKAKSDAGATG